MSCVQRRLGRKTEQKSLTTHSLVHVVRSQAPSASIPAPHNGAAPRHSRRLVFHHRRNRPRRTAFADRGLRPQLRRVHRSRRKDLALIGQTIGPYQVLSKVGEGGMGEVYRAHDTSLDRDVALKILPDAFVHDADRLARFQREAKVLASLNHPHIASIYGLERSATGTALIMELVQGPTLADMV